MLWATLCPLQNSYVEALTLNMTIFGDRTFREVIKVKLPPSVIMVGPYFNRISTLVRKGRDTKACSLFLSLEKRPYEDTARRQESTNQEERPH